jgi:hypothetical protein
MTTYVTKLEHTVAGWLKKVPHLPVSGQAWLAENIWWIILVSAIISSISVLFALVGFFSILSVISSIAAYAYAIGPMYTGWTVFTALVSLLLLALGTIVLWVAVKPLQLKTKKGWTILFIALLIEAASVVIDSVLTLSPLGIISGLILGGIGIAIGAYFIFEIRGQFAHQTKAAAKKA